MAVRWALAAASPRARLLDFGRTLSAEDARRMADRLGALPEVEWVVPNEREISERDLTPAAEARVLPFRRPASAVRVRRKTWPPAMPWPASRAS